MHHFHHSAFPNVGFVRLSAILKVIPIGKSTWWLGVKNGRFPKPIKLCSRVTVWRAEDIIELITNSGGSIGDNSVDMDGDGLKTK